ncbi:MAG: TraB/GumN family protein [Hyphomonadaceae bacterium]
MTLRFLAAAALAGLGLVACTPKEAADTPDATEQASAPSGPNAAETPSDTAATAPIEAGGPALWLTGDADTKIYLLGTVHVLPPDLEWRTDKIDRALGEAKAVYFETDVEPNEAEMLPVLTRLGIYPPGQTLSSRLTEEQRTTLATATKDLGIPLAGLDVMRPWLAAVSISDRVIVNAGYSSESGVERKLMPDARAAGKEIRKFETIEEQLRIFADLPEEVQIKYLMSCVEDIGSEQEISDLVAAWASGDTDLLEELMIVEDMGETPEIYDAMLVKRNANWTREIQKLTTSETGTLFVAVGAAHLVGKDSVVAMLTDKGVSVSRVE